MKRVFITVDLGFGDAGKGNIVDSLVRRYRAGLVVRYNGGCQAAHSVYNLEGVHHTFSQFGATFVPGTYTLLGRYMLVNPLTMQMEADVLYKKGVTDAFNRVFIDGRARIVTPYHRAVNRLRELARGAGKHGSCGHGIGETVADSIGFGDSALCAADLHSMELFTVKLLATRDRMRHQVNQIEGIPDSLEATKQLSTFDYDLRLLLKRYQSFYESVCERIINPYAVVKLLSGAETVVFEGAQGVLLDENYGFHPYTTWSTTTTRNAKLMLEEAEITEKPTTIGITRTYMTRHGAGPFPTEDAQMTKHLKDANNPRNDWQDHIRCGALDLVLLGYALHANGPVDCLAVTHMDKVTIKWPITKTYTAPEFVSGIRTWLPSSLEEQREFTQWLYKAKPNYTMVDNATILSEIQERLGVPIGIESHGPGPNNKIFRGDYAKVVDEDI